MKTQNKVQLIGYVGKDPVLQTFADGSKMTKLRVATDHYTKSAEGKPVQHTTWHEVVAFDKKSEMALNNFSKGSHVLVEGFIVYRTYLDRSGHTHYITQIRVKHFLNLDR
ncbi:MAG: ssb [Chitinophagaceae bacterium]|nr:ssb [Chitinophagaceae bacterium]